MEVSPSGSTVKSDHLFLSCDWGTSAFRLRLVRRHPLKVMDEYATAEGVQAVSRALTGASRRRAFLRILRRGVSALGVAHRPEIPLIISGMATSNLGWRPMPYTRTPAQADGGDLLMTEERLAGRRVRFVSGLRTHDDVMRGEEVELAGLFHSARRSLPDDCIVVLTGTHAKHVRLSRGVIAGFRTYPTGELFALLCRHSTLCGPAARGFSRSAFLSGVAAAKTLGLSATLFQARAGVIVGRLHSGRAADFLSGALIAAELAALPRTGHVVLAAGSGLAMRYRLALRMLRRSRKLTVIAPRLVKHAVVAGHALLLRTP